MHKLRVFPTKTDKRWLDVTVWRDAVTRVVCKVLEGEGVYPPTAHFLTRNGEWYVGALTELLGDGAGRQTIYRQGRKTCARLGATAYLVCSSAWVAIVPPGASLDDPHQAPERQERLIFLLETYALRQFAVVSYDCSGDDAVVWLDDDGSEGATAPSYLGWLRGGGS